MRKRSCSPESRDNREDGFTLIELMVVVLIIGVLVGIAVPAFLGAQNGAKSKAAQSNARSALSAAKTLHAEQEAYLITDGATTLSLLQAAEPSLGWVTTMGSPSGSTDNISWTSNATQFVIAVRDKNNACYWIRDTAASGLATTGTWFGKTVDTDATTCDADGAGPVWKSSQTLGWPKVGASA